MRILTISHDAFYGAPRVAIDVSRALADGRHEFEFVLLADGPLAHEFHDAGRTHLLPSRTHHPLESEGQERFERVLRDWRPSLIYVNTVGALAVLEVAARVATPVVLHVHELDRVMRRYCSPFLETFLTVPRFYVTASAAVRRDLLRRFPVPAEKVVVAHDAIDTARVDRLLAEPHSPWRRPRPAMVAGAGVCAPRKGTDVWLHVMAALRRRHGADVGGVWFGPSPSLASVDPFHRRLARLLDRLDLHDVVTFTDHRPNYYPLLNETDVFVLSSREDACPLVVLDAMYLGKPVVHFDAGGTHELVRGDAGVAIPCFAVERMADAVTRFLEHPVSRRRAGAIGTRRVEQSLGIGRLATHMDGVWTRAVSGLPRQPA